jgi:hypothetical protein
LSGNSFRNGKEHAGIALFELIAVLEWRLVGTNHARGPILAVVTPVGDANASLHVVIFYLGGEWFFISFKRLFCGPSAPDCFYPLPFRESNCILLGHSEIQ